MLTAIVKDVVAVAGGNISNDVVAFLAKALPELETEAPAAAPALAASKEVARSASSSLPTLLIARIPTEQLVAELQEEVAWPQTSSGREVSLDLFLLPRRISSLPRVFWHVGDSPFPGSVRMYSRGLSIFHTTASVSFALLFSGK
jgi:hypothetical protein